jgi:hypothetical protein
MATTSQQTTTPQAAQETKAKAPKERRTFGAGFVDAAGNRLEVYMQKRADGSFRTYVRHVAITGKGKSAKRSITRGASETHADEKSARAAWERAQSAAEKTGWSRKERRAGFAAKPDEFDLASLPKPAKK